jgi:hypothetical protein
MPAFLPFDCQPLAHYHLGRVYEALGQPAKAIDAYGCFVQN